MNFVGRPAGPGELEVNRDDGSRIRLARRIEETSSSCNFHRAVLRRGKGRFDVHPVYGETRTKWHGELPTEGLEWHSRESEHGGLIVGEHRPRRNGGARIETG